MKKKIVSIQPLLDVQKIEEKADSIIHAAQERAKRETASMETRTVCRKLMKAYRETPLIANWITPNALQNNMARIKAEFSRDPEIVAVANKVLNMLQAMWRAADDILILPGVEDDLPQVCANAIAAGVLYGALLRDIGLPRGKGKTEWPEWTFIREVWKAASKLERKPNRKEVIDTGLAKFQAATGKPSTKQLGAFLPHFKEQVIEKISR